MSSDPCWIFTPQQFGDTDRLTSYLQAASRAVARAIGKFDRFRFRFDGERLVAIESEGIGVAIDHLDHAMSTSKAATAAGSVVNLLIEVDIGMGRCGVEPVVDTIVTSAADSPRSSASATAAKTS